MKPPLTYQRVKYFIAFCVGVLFMFTLTLYDPPRVADTILDEAPCIVRAIGTGGTEEGLDQLVVNAEAAGLIVARTDDYVAVVEVDCE